MKFQYNLAIVVFATFCLMSCDKLTRDIVIELPEPERVLVVECYLTPGEPYRLLLTETKGFFEALDACPLIKGATVIIRHNNQVDTLQEATYFSNECSMNNLFGIIPFFNADYTRFYNYGSSSICPTDFEHPFELEVYDPQGNRHAVASTFLQRPIPIDEIQITWRDDGRKASALVTAIDDGNTVDFYRLMLHQTSLVESFGIARDPEFDITIDDARFFNGSKIAFGTGFDFKDGDTLIASCYHIEKAFHDFYETLQDAESASFNPFGVPSRILTNIQGGMGIFTANIPMRDTLIIQK